ncbi:ABC transporter permease [Rhodococcus sp. OK302]|uniref:ABC transporter permease n=1 Tax=Rhodococcus sp. OK302 TaxID=1882769 RepID=UPI000B9435C0|nr:ABC transporter permease [Rhodococcus sp. OK302]OYD69815.1 peptide/nickel transport system permease protein [Rhodococcus sp. OK302]
MSALIVKRLAAMIAILVGLSAVIFYLQSISPLDPVHAQLGGQASAEAVAQRTHELGLDRPVTAQFWSYLVDLVHGDLGSSYRTRRSVTEDLGAYAPATLELAFYGIMTAVVLAALLAFGSTLKWRGAVVFRTVLFVGASTPTFLLGILGIVIFYQQLGWLPASGRTGLTDAPTGPTGLMTVDGLLNGRLDVTADGLRHLVLPVVAIALGPAVAIGRVLTSSLAADQASDYARTARSKGLSEWQVLVKHSLRNAMGAALSMTGLQIGLMFAGVLVVEQVFGWPGLGQYIAQSIPVGDFPAIAGVTLILGVVYIVVNTLVDIAQAKADPRIAA